MGLDFESYKLQIKIQWMFAWWIWQAVETDKMTNLSPNSSITTTTEFFFSI
jgi:hypothetical protein